MRCTQVATVYTMFAVGLFPYLLLLLLCVQSADATELASVLVDAPVLEQRDIPWNLKVIVIAFLLVLIDSLVSLFLVARGRVYLAGFSNGAMMAYEAGCELSSRLSAIAVVGGSMTGKERSPARPLSVIIFHGTAD